MFRGPKQDLTRPHVAFLGGSETFGRFVARPFPELVEDAIGHNCVNLGCVNAGLDAFVNDGEVLRILKGSRAVVIQLPGAQNLSNRFYRVHPRRNDRFLTASPMLAAIYRDVDFTEFAFTRHMLGALQARSAERFELVLAELRQAWLARMRLLLRDLRAPVVLLWLRYGPDSGPLGAEPLFVGSDMAGALVDDRIGLIDIPVDVAGRCDDLRGMAFGPLQAPIAAHLIGPRTHATVAARVAGSLKTLLAT
jgi:hypothetical protein